MAKSLTGLFYELFDNAMESFETAFPGIVSAVNADGTVDVRPSVRNCLKNMQIEPDGVGGEVNEIKGVPVLWPGTAAALVKFELSEGDPVLLVASSRDLRNWKSGGWAAGTTDPRSFCGNDLNDLMALPCRRESHGAESPKTTVKIGRDGSVEIECSEIEIEAERVRVSGELAVGGGVTADGEVTANAKIPASAVKLSTHVHPTAVGPTSPPTPGS